MADTDTLFAPGTEERRLFDLNFPSLETQAQQRGYLAQVPVGVVRGLGLAAASVPRMASAIPGVRTFTEPLAEGIERTLPLSSGGVLEGGIESGTRSLAIGGLTYAALAGTGGLAAPGVIGLGSTAARIGALTALNFGAGELAETRKRLEGMNQELIARGETPLTTAEIYTIATTRGLIEGGGEGLGNWLIGHRVLSGKAAEAVKGAAAKWFPGVAGRLGREAGVIAAEEVPTEMLQAGGQSGVERGVLGQERVQTLEQAGQPVAPPAIAAAGQVVPQTLVASALFGGAQTVLARRPMPTSAAATTVVGTPTPAEAPVIPRPLPFVSTPRATDVVNPITDEGAVSTPVPPPRTAGTPVMNPLTGERLTAVSTPVPPPRTAGTPVMNPLTGERLTAESATEAPTIQPLPFATPGPRLDEATAGHLLHVALESDPGNVNAQNDAEEWMLGHAGDVEPDIMKVVRGISDTLRGARTTPEPTAPFMPPPEPTATPDVGRIQVDVTGQPSVPLESAQSEYKGYTIQQVGARFHVIEPDGTRGMSYGTAEDARQSIESARLQPHIGDMVEFGTPPEQGRVLRTQAGPLTNYSGDLSLPQHWIIARSDGSIASVPVSAGLRQNLTRPGATGVQTTVVPEAPPATEAVVPAPQGPSSAGPSGAPAPNAASAPPITGAEPAVPGATETQPVGPPPTEEPSWVPYGTAGYEYRKLSPARWEIRDAAGEVQPGMQPSSERAAKAMITKQANVRLGLSGSAEPAFVRYKGQDLYRVGDQWQYPRPDGTRGHASSLQGAQKHIDDLYGAAPRGQMPLVDMVQQREQERATQAEIDRQALEAESGTRLRPTVAQGPPEGLFEQEQALPLGERRVSPEEQADFFAGSEDRGPELQTMIRRLGGINARAADIASELMDVTSPKETGTTGLLNRNGMSADQMVQELNNLGYLEAPTIEELKTRLDASLKGRPQHQDFVPGQYQVGQPSAAPRPPSAAQQDVQRRLSQRFRRPGQVTPIADTDLIHVQVTPEHGLLVATPERLGADQGFIEATYGPEVAAQVVQGGAAVMGFFEQVPPQDSPNGKISLSIQVAQNSTNIVLSLDHELEHMAESLGLLRPGDTDVLDRTISRRGGMPGFADPAEARAQYIAEQLNKPRSVLMETLPGRIIARIQQFIDTLARSIGIRTSGQIVREFRSGAVFAREAGEGNAATMERLQLPPGPQHLAPESRVVNPDGTLKVLYHGTARQYEDFAVEKLGTGAGQMYSGFFFAEDPAVASRYADQQRITQSAAEIQTAFDRIHQLIAEAEAGLAQAEPGGPLARAWAIDLRMRRQRLSEMEQALKAGPNIRPVYLNIQKPFDTTADFDEEDIARIAEVVDARFGLGTSDYAMEKMNAALDMRNLDGRDVYRAFARYGQFDNGEDLGSRRLTEALQDLGYDGIYHEGAQDGKVWVAFTPEQIIPVLGNATRPRGRLQVTQRPPQQQDLPGVPPAVRAHVAPVLPPATPRTSPAGVQTEPVPVEHYQFMQGILSPEERAQFNARAAAGVPTFRKEIIPDVQMQAAGEDQATAWRDHPRDLQRTLDEVHAGKRGITGPQFVALSLMADEERTMAKALHDLGLIDDARFTEIENAWIAPNALAAYARQGSSEAGRTLRVVRYAGGWLGGWSRYAEALANLEAKINAIPEDQRDTFREKLKAAFAAGDYPTLRTLAAQIPNSSLRERFFEFYYGSILSGLGTHSTNEYSTLSYQLFHNALVRPIVGVTDRIVSNITGRERQIYAGEMLPALLAQFKHLPGIFRDAWWLWRGDPRAQAIPGFFRQETGTGRDQGSAQGAWERATYAVDWPLLGKKAGEPIQTMRRLAPFVTAASRAMGAMDVAMSISAFDQEVAARARREALRQHIPADQRAAFEADYRAHFLTNHPPDVGDALFEEVSSVMKQQVFHDGMGVLGRTLVGLRHVPVLGPFMQLLLPFAGTPDALLRRGLELLPGAPFIPGGAGYSWYKGNVSWKWGGWLPMVGKEAMTNDAMYMLAKQAVGTMMVMGLAALWEAGRISGPPPSDPGERDAQQRAGIVPYSIKLGDTWYSWHRFEPMSMPLGILTTVFDTLQRRNTRMEQRGEVPTGFLHDSLAIAAVGVQSAITYILDASYFSGLANFMAGTVQGARTGTGDIPKGVMRQVASIVTPFVGLQRSLIAGLDSSGLIPGTPAGQVSIRQPQTLGETIAGSWFPFALMEGLGPQPRLTVFGQPLARQTTPLGELVPFTPPIQRGHAPSNELEETLRRLNYYPSQPSKTDAISGKALAPAIYRRLQELRGPLVQAGLERTINQAGFDRLLPVEAKKKLSNATADATRQAKKALALEMR